MKSMWRALGPNLDERNAERTAGTLEAVELIYQSIDRDCLNDKPGTRTSTKDDEAVHQIVKDLVNNQALVGVKGMHPFHGLRGVCCMA